MVPGLICEVSTIRREFWCGVEVGSFSNGGYRLSRSIHKDEGSFDCGGSVVCMVFEDGNEKMTMDGMDGEIGESPEGYRV